jgi:Tfp pilus assembly PilM family ATPase
MSRRSLFQSDPPDVAIEIDASHVAAARLATHGGGASVTADAREPLPPGLVTPALATQNISDVAAVGRAVSQVLTRLGGRVSRAALVIPDPAAKVSLIRFDTTPANARDLAELVRWQVRKSAPFPIDQAVVSFTPGARPADGGQEFLVTLARADIVQQYEEACASAGVHAGLVDIATTCIINGVLAGGAVTPGDAAAGATARPGGADWMLVNATDAYTTLAVVRGSDVIFFRNREHDSDATLADVVHQTAMYYEDRLKGAGFSRVLLAGTAVHSVDPVRHSLQDRLDVRIELVSHPELAALTGLLLRERKAA